MFQRALVVPAVLLAGLSLAHSDEPPPKVGGQEIRALIDKLASPNPRPITGDEDKRMAPDYELPSGFDREKQRQVHRARSTLRKIGPQAFPYLIERWEDERYCLTVSHGLSGYCRNRTVGEICKATIFDQIQPYSYWPRTEDDPRGKPRRPSYPSRFLRSQKQAREWWEENKEKTLHQIQLEVIDWVIAEEAKRPNDFTEEERETLRQIRGALMRDGKPLPPGNYNAEDIEQ